MKYDAEYPDIPEYKERHKLSLEKKATGVYLSGHPLEEYKDVLDAMNVNTFRIASVKDDEGERDYFDGRSVELLGILTSVRKRATRMKKLMANAVLEDLYGTIEMVVFPTVLSTYEDFLTEDSIVTIKGKVDIVENEDPQIIVESVSAYSRPDKAFAGKTLYVKIPRDSTIGMEELKKIIRTCPGRDPIVVYNEKTKERFKTGGMLCVQYTQTLMERLTGAYGAENVVLK